VALALANRTDAPPRRVVESAHSSLRIASGYCGLQGKRPRNEDFVGMVTPGEPERGSKGVLAAVADGLSGRGGGREAAEYSVRGLLSDFYATPDTWEVTVAFDRVLNAINRWLLAQGAAHLEREAMATTLSSLLLRGRRYTFAHVGDTRIYLLRGDRLSRLTTDHVWDRAEMRHVLTRALGMDTRLAMDYGEGEIAIGDRFLLTSDGVWSALKDSEIRELLAAHADVEAAARALCEQAIERGSQDNASALVIAIEDLPPLALRESAAAALALEAPRELKVGEQIDGLSVLERLHASRATLLYKVKDDATGDHYVLKTLQPDFAQDPAERVAFQHEEWLARRAVARFFPQYAPVSQRRTALYFLMTWHAGATLQQKLDADTHFNVPDVLQLASKLTRGVAALHRRGILHRDIKPANIHLGEDGELRILDFGVAISGLEEGPPHDQAGTPSYIAPEQYAGAKPSEQMDLYAVGVTLYHALTRRYPYGEIEPFQRPRFGDPTPPTRYRPDIPQWLENLILKAVARDPKARFETADELLLALQRGAARPLSAPRPTPLAERDPVTFWRLVAVVSLAANLLLIYLLAVHS
jgi:serine/threonine protein phosphatase PrpC